MKNIIYPRWRLWREQPSAPWAAVFSLPDESPHGRGSRERPAVLVRHWPVDVALEEREHGEPDASAAALLVSSRVSQSVVVQEESGSDVKRDEHVD